MNEQVPEAEASVARPGGLSALRELAQNGRLALRLLGDGRVPRALKAIPILALVYLISPIDLIPDAIPLLTQIDDLAIILIALKLFIDMAPSEVVAELEGGQSADDAEAAIDADYRVRED